MERLRVWADFGKKNVEELREKGEGTLGDRVLIKSVNVMRGETSECENKNITLNDELTVIMMPLTEAGAEKSS